MTATVCSIVFLAQSTIGCGFGDGHGLFGHHRARPVAVVRQVPATVGCCDVCGVETTAVQAEIATLTCAARWRQRDNAAHRLRDFDWQCHPEILPALVRAMLVDCEEEVREEAAESLAKIDPPPCTPEVHAALARASECDPDHATRKQARKALARVGTQCAAPCSVCGPIQVGPGEVIVDQPLGGQVLVAPPEGVIVSPPSYGATPVEPGLEMDGIEPMPPATTTPPPFPDPSIPPLPEAASPFGPPQARRLNDDRISERRQEERDDRAVRVAARDDEDDDERDSDDLRRSEPSRRRRFLFSLLPGRGR